MSPPLLGSERRHSRCLLKTVGSVLLVARRVGIVTRGHGVGVADLPVRPVDHDLASAFVPDDLLGASLCGSLGRVVRTRSLGTWRLDIPSATGTRDNVSV